MGRHCRVCGRNRPNERFSGHGHKIGICHDCSRMPKRERLAILDFEFLYHAFWDQKSVSPGNLSQFGEIADRSEGKVKDVAEAMLEAARLHPRRKKRLGFLYSNHRHVFDRLVALGIADDGITPIIEQEMEYDKMAEEFEARRLQAGGESPITQAENTDDDCELPF